VVLVREEQPLQHLVVAQLGRQRPAQLRQRDPARYVPTVLGEIPQLLEMARPDFPPCNLSLMTSLSFRMGSLSAAITTSVGEGA
jgi:hypothetical protein